MKTAILVGLSSLTLALHSSAFLRGTVTDEKAVAHAQVIVIAHLKKDSLVRSPKDQYATSASAVLVVSKVLKGPFLIEQIPIEISYGLSASIGGEIRYVNTKTGKSYADEYVKTGEIRLYDTGNSLLSYTPFTGDLNQDQIWLLRANVDGSGSATKKLRIWDPEDIQPALKEAALSKLIAESQSKSVGQPATDQPATAPELKSQGKDKPQPESEGRSR